MRRFIAALLITATAVFIVTTSQGASASDPGAEANFISLINQHRANNGRGALQPHPVLTAKAQAWAAHMAATNTLSHSNLTDGITVGWRKLGENVGYGSNVGQLHNAFVASPEHNANMLDPSFQWVGVGVAYGNGRMWVAEVFMNGDAPPPPAGNPIGNVEMATRVPGAVAVSGWTLDPNSPNPVTVHAYIDGVWAGQLTANRSRPDVGAAFPGYGNGHGYFGYVPAKVGPHILCVYAINQGQGTTNPALGCTGVGNTPYGNLDQASPVPSGTTISGWALGPDTTSPIAVHLYFNGQWLTARTAGTNRPDVGAAFPGFGSDHGFSAVIPNETGFLCAYAIAAGGGVNPLIGCRFVDTNPIGSLDAATRKSNGVLASGWALDHDTAGPVEVHIYVDGVMVAAIPANISRPDLTAVSPSNPHHAFESMISIPPGRHLTCAYGINQDSGTTNPLIGCRYTT